MRQIQDAVDHARERERFLSPRNGDIGWGGADFDETLKATVGEEYLRVLNRGGTPSEAFPAATAAGEDSIKKWNERGCRGRASISGLYALHHDKCAAESIALGFHCRFHRFREPSPAAMRPASTVRFQSAIIDGTKYCGPVCLSSLTGFGTKEIATILRRKFDLKAVRGLLPRHATWFIECAGYEIETMVSFESRTLADWRRAESSQDVFLIELPDHFVLVRSDQIVCTQFDGKVSILANSQYLSEIVQVAYRIVGLPNSAKLEAMTKSSRQRSLAVKQATLF